MGNLPMNDLLNAGRNQKIADALKLKHKYRSSSEQRNRNRAGVEQGILSDGKFAATLKTIQKQGFQDILKTTLKAEFGTQGLLRNITESDLRVFAEKIKAAEKGYIGGIKPSQVVNASLPIDRARCNREIPWATPFVSRYNPVTGSLVVQFLTAASGKHGTNKHFVNVEFLDFGTITKHLLMLEPDPKQAQSDAKALQDSYVKFDCDCGRHTYWYRYIASIGKFAYVGKNPLGRQETGFPKIRNPNLKGIACKHVLRTMQALQTKGVQDFLAKAIMNRYKSMNSQKIKETQATKKALEKSIKQQAGDSIEVLSNAEKNISPNLRKRYQHALQNGLMMRNAKNKLSREQKQALLAKIHRS